MAKRTPKRKVKLTEGIIRTLKPEAGAYRVWDTEQGGLFVHVLPSGKRIFRHYYLVAGKQRTITIGEFGSFTLKQARDQASVQRGELVQKIDPLEQKAAERIQAKRDKVATLGAYLDAHYAPWATGRHKDSTANVPRVKSVFADWLELPMDKITATRLTEWVKGRQKQGIKTATIHRDYSALQSVLTRAVADQVLDVSPLGAFDGLPELVEDKRIRYLSPDEETRLRATLQARDDKLKADRISGNRWRAARNKPLLPKLPAAGFGDYLQPFILTALNTGCRRGELFHLDWSMVDLRNRVLTVSAFTAKSKKTRHIPMNDEALDVLKRWKKTTGPDGLVFANPETGQALTTIKKAWRKLMTDAEIEDFRLHDCRHHFASMLVINGVDLYRVAALLGHSSIETTKRYAHLQPDHMRADVELLNVANRK